MRRVRDKTGGRNDRRFLRMDEYERGVPGPPCVLFQAAIRIVAMLWLTHAARDLISEMLADQAEGVVLRVSSGPGGPQIGTDRVRAGDQTFNYGPKCVLAVDQMVLRTISGRTLGVESIEGQPSLVLIGD